MLTVEFKCVAVVACSSNYDIEERLFAWNSTCLGDVPERFKNMDDNFLDSEIRQGGNDVENFMEGPQMVGLSIWEGVMAVNYHTDLDYELSFVGKWRDLTKIEYQLLADRNLDELVNLNRFAVIMRG